MKSLIMFLSAAALTASALAGPVVVVPARPVFVAPVRVAPAPVRVAPTPTPVRTAPAPVTAPPAPKASPTPSRPANAAETTHTPIVTPIFVPAAVHCSDDRRKRKEC